MGVLMFCSSQAHLRRAIIGAFLLSIGVCQSARATTIDFEDQSGPSFFASAGPAQSIVEGPATFNGGVILTNTANLPANQTSVYGTANFSDPSLTNPLTVNFLSPITNFFLDVINGEPFAVNYTVADNLGHTATFLVASNTSSGAQTIGFAATGTLVTISAEAAGGNFDFFIDNVHYNESLPPGLNQTPIPAALPLFASALGGLGFFGWRRRKNAPTAA